MSEATSSQPTVFVLYGATGDLARRMVIPAFYRLAQAGLLPTNYRLIGNGRGDVSHDEFRERVQASLEEFGPKPSDGPWDDFAAKLLFAGGGFDKDNPGTLVQTLEQVAAELGDFQLVHYFAVPPQNFAKLTDGIAAHNLAEGSRVVFEKPYGTSPEDFHTLDQQVKGILDEEQVFRIDHFLGKEAAQNLHVMRFTNGMLEGVWNRKHIEAVQIDVPETLDIADRANFYDNTGAFLDMIVTHLFQLVAEVAMEPPVSTSPTDLQNARESAIAAFCELSLDEVVLGQFDGYTETEGIAADSKMDTFVAARLWVDSDRWRDVPFLLRTGKRMAVTEQRVSLIFRKPSEPFHDVSNVSNVLTFKLKGEGSIELSLAVKRPGPELAIETSTMTLPLGEIANGVQLTAYARMIHDVMAGDRSLFTRPDGLEQAWRVAAPVLDNRPEPEPYAPGSWGPASAAKLAEPCGWLLGE